MEDKRAYDFYSDLVTRARAALQQAGVDELARYSALFPLVLMRDISNTQTEPVVRSKSVISLLLEVSKLVTDMPDIYAALIVAASHIIDAMRRDYDHK